MMPFASRDFSGQWQWVMDNLGADSDGCVIENKRRNKGMFIADFSFATKAARPEWSVAIVHLREQACVVPVARCNDNPQHAVQNYSSANEHCECTLVFNLVTPGNAGWEIAANAITCDGFPLAHASTSALATLTAVVQWLNTNFSELGEFTDTHAGALTTNITLTGCACQAVTLPFTADAA